MTVTDLPSAADVREVPDHHVVIIGAGFGGIGAAIELERAGIDDFVVLEKWDGPGGTWRANTYPGVAVDIPSLIYSFSYEQRADWSRVFAPGSELLAYAEDVVRRRGLALRMRFDTTVEEMRFDELADLWRITTSADGRIRSVNRAAESVLGCDAAAAEAMRCGDLVALRDGARTLTCDGRCQLLELHGEQTVEVLRTGPNGQRQPLLASATPLVAGDGRIVEVVHSFRDITSVKQADEAKTLFLATASHELKTPLTVIRGFAQMLRLTGLDPDQHHQATAAIEARATQLAGIVERLLMTSRIEAGHVDLDPTLCRIDEVLLQRTRELESATSREVERRVPDDLPLVWADLDGLTTVLDHLLENAVKYSPDGGPVAVSAEVDGDEVRLRCHDDGIGMTEEQRARCFDRFWQAEGTDVRRFGGTGIGLYIVRSLVEAMDGTISVESTPGLGSTFTIALRRYPPRPAPPDAPAAEAGSDATGTSIVGEFMKQVGMPVPDRPASER